MTVETLEAARATGAQVSLSLEEARFLADASATLASSFDYRATLSAVARKAVPVLADVCTVDLLDAGGELRRLEAAAADPAIADRLRATDVDIDERAALAR